MESLFFLLLCLSPLVAMGLGILMYWQSKRFKALQAEAKSVRERLVAAENNLVALQNDSQHALREGWLKNLRNLVYANEVEVEIKFVYPLLLYLGYQDTDFSVRYKVQIQAGREQLQKEADWVIWKRKGSDTKATLVIEAKSPLQPLDSIVQNQGRSYAFSMNAPKYVLTNGIDLMVYERGIESDRCSIQVPVRDLATRWLELSALIGADIN